MQFAPRDRLLIFAPHPDDETLAAGILIQRALAAGAVVRVVFATDGDNNPWPQRWLERRWRIGAAERERWAARRHAEALAALGMLGDGISIRFLGWPDQGLTDGLMASDAPVQALAVELADFAPSHVVLPSLADLHPDHGALRVMIDLALLRHAHACTLLGYTVHGHDPDLAPGDHADDPAALHRKLAALQAYSSQLALSRRRLLGLASRTETFALKQAPGARINRARERVFDLPWPVGWPVLRRHALLLVVAGDGPVRRLCIDLPRFARVGADVPGVIDPLHRVEFTHTGLRITLAEAVPALSVHAKVHRKGARVFIFDRWPWQVNGQVATDAASAGGAAFGTPGRFV